MRFLFVAAWISCSVSLLASQTLGHAMALKPPVITPRPPRPPPTPEVSLPSTQLFTSPPPATTMPNPCPPLEGDVVISSGVVLANVIAVELSYCCIACSSSDECLAFTHVPSDPLGSSTIGKCTLLAGDVSGRSNQAFAVTGIKVAPTTVPDIPEPTTNPISTEPTEYPVPVTPRPTAVEECPILRTRTGIKDYYYNYFETIRDVTMERCCYLCNSNPSCLAFVLRVGSQSTGGDCYLMDSTTDGFIADLYSTTGVKGEIGPEPTPTEPPVTVAPRPTAVEECPSIRPRTGINGDDLDEVNYATLERCCYLCNSDPSCVAFVFQPGYWEPTTGTCTLKSTVAGFYDNWFMKSGLKSEIGPEPTPTIPSTPRPTAVEECPRLLPKVGINGDDYKSFDGVTVERCCFLCNSDASCVAFTFVWGSCYLQSTTDGTYDDSFATSGVRAELAPTPPPPPPTPRPTTIDECPILYPRFGNTGNAFRLVDDVTLERCCFHCNVDKECKAFNYNLNLRECYLLSSVQNFVPLPRTTSGVKGEVAP